MARVTGVLEDTARPVHTSRVRAVRQSGVFPARHLHVAIVRGGDDQVVVQTALEEHHTVTRLLTLSVSSHLLTADRELGTEAGAPAAVLPADQPVVGGVFELIALVAHHHRAAPRLVPHRVPGGQAAVGDAGLAAHHWLTGRPVCRGVTEPPSVPGNSQVRSGQFTTGAGYSPGWSTPDPRSGPRS